MSEDEKVRCDKCGVPFDETGPAGGAFIGGESFEYCKSCLSALLQPAAEFRLDNPNNPRNSCSEWSGFTEGGTS